MTLLSTKKTYDIPLRWRDLDHQGHVYHATFLELLDEARTLFLQDLGVATPDAYVMVRLEIDFIDQLLIENTPATASFEIDMVGTTSLRISETLKSNETIISKSLCTIVMWNSTDKRSRPLTEHEKSSAEKRLSARSGGLNA